MNQSENFTTHLQQINNKALMGGCSSDCKTVMMRRKNYSSHQLSIKKGQGSIQKEPAKMVISNIGKRKINETEIMQQIDFLFRRFDSNFSGFLEESEILKMLLYLEAISKTGEVVNSDDVNYLLQHTHNPKQKRISREELLSFYLKQEDSDIY